MSSSNYNYREILPGTDLGDLIHTHKTSFWQSPLWAQILQKTHQAKDIFIVSWDNHSFLIERRTIINKFTGLYMLGIDWESLSDACLGFIRENITTKNDLFLQIEPISPLPNSVLSSTRAPFRRFIEPVTAILQLGNISEETLLSSFAEKGRYNIRLAQKRWVTTRWVQGSDIEKTTGKTYVEAFFDLLDETTKRDWFAHNTLNYYQHFIETLESYHAGGLLIAEKDWVLHAAAVFAYWGDTAIYYYGASSSDSTIRRDMATYLLQWEAIREAMKRKCSIYDFLGISPDGRGKLAGVTEFKLRFNPEKKHWPIEWVMVFKSMTLGLLRFTSKARKLKMR